MRLWMLALGFVALAARVGWAATACIPNALQSTLPSGISLVGHGAVPDPLGVVTYVIRGSDGNPYPGGVVTLNFTNCGDVRLATEVTPGILVDCARRTVSGVANAAGVVTFTIVGNAVGAVASASPCLSVTADGVPLRSPVVSAFDLDGVNGVTALDLSIAAGDLYSGQYRARADYNADGRLDGLDLCQLARVFFREGSTASGTPCP
jgi:hypothetical protein